MKKDNSALIKGIVSVLLLLAIYNSCAQIPQKDILKKYVQIDSSIHRSSVLILYTDKTFINYGTLNNISNTEYYVWFDYGNWIMANSELICTSKKKLLDQPKVVNEIKMYHTWRNDYRLYDSYYEYVKGTYKCYSFILIKDKAIDLNKKIEYHELQSNELISKYQ